MGQHRRGLQGLVVGVHELCGSGVRRKRPRHRDHRARTRYSVFVLVRFESPFFVLFLILTLCKGHNFGLYHDGQSGPAASCGANDGLMGYGNNHEEFSVCSLNSMEDYFDGDGNGMQCLATGWSSSDGVTSNYGGGDSGEPLTPSPVSSPANTPSPVSSSSNADCVHIEVGFTNIDGDWHVFEDPECNGHTRIMKKNAETVSRLL